MSISCSTCRQPRESSQFTSNRDGTRRATCEPCRERRRAWYRKNAEREKANVVTWRKENPEKVREYERNKVANAEARDPGVIRRRHKQWRDSHREHVREKGKLSARALRAKHPLLGIWGAMVRRCEVPNDPGYANYGGRGIRVCDRWKSFPNFESDMGPRPSPKHSVERKDNNGDYEPSNCRWATRTEQARNTRRNSLLTYDGQTRCISEWAELKGLKVGVIHKRLKLGWSIGHALTTPIAERVLLEYQGRSQTIVDWCRELDLPYQEVVQRLRRGWPPERAFKRRGFAG